MASVRQYNARHVRAAKRARIEAYYDEHRKPII